MLEADALISVCKMKTHALEYITGAVKNQYGCVQGFHKAKGHTLYSDPVSFARMLGDLNRLVKPRLYILDGITAMEGNGPTSGDPVPMRLLLLSADPVALDSVFCHLIHLDPQLVPTNVQGEQMGLGTWRPENIELLTEEGPMELSQAVERYGNPDFRVKRSREKARGWMGAVGIFKIFRRKPRIRGGSLPEMRRLCGELSGGRESPAFYRWQGQAAGVRL